MEDTSVQDTQEEFLAVEAEEEELASLGYRKNPLSLILPVQESVAKEARMLVGSRNLQVEHLAEVAGRDPVFMLALLRMANSMMYRQDRSAITTARSAVVRLGSSSLVELIDSITDRENKVPPEVWEEFDGIKEQGATIAHVAGLIASTVDKSVLHEAKTVGLLSVIGHLVICANLGERYVEAAEGRSLPSLNAKLRRDFEQDPLEIRRDYLKRHGFPEALMFAVDPESVSTSSSKLSLRFIINSAVELVDVYQTPKWERFTHKDNLPSSSSLRLLRISDDRYKRMIEGVEQYLDSLNAVEEEAEKPDAGEGIDLKVEEEEKEENPSVYTLELEEEKRKLLKEAEAAKLEEESDDEPTVIGSLPSEKELSGLVRRKKLGSQLRSDEEGLVEECVERVVEENLLQLCEDSRTVKQLLRQVLALLTTEGPFVRAALVVLGENQDIAHVYEASGEGIEAGDTVTAKDPFCPLFSARMKIQSCNNDNFSENAPFGVSSYALSPLDLGEDTPVILYVDCGNDGSISFAARRVFRYTIGQLSSALPQLAGAI